MIPVDEFVGNGNARSLDSYRSLRAQIESGFADLVEAVAGEAAILTLVERARENWTAADGYATALFSVPTEAGNRRTVEMMQRFHGKIVATSDRLEAVYQQLAGEIQKDYEVAALSYERSIWLAGIAGALSLLALAGGVLLIGRILGASVDRLVDGAVRFAEGDRNHRIQVQVPPELHRVAEEFNHMIGRIHESEEALAKLALLDSLTSLGNRRAFETAFAETWARVQRFDEPCCLMAIDIDHFKCINDTYGHAAGDEVLRVMAAVMKRNIRPFDVAFRVGGEEFAVVMPNTTVDVARKVAERLRQEIESTSVPFQSDAIHLTISIGVAQGSNEMDQKLFAESADIALYEAKSVGRNRVVVSGLETPREMDFA